MDCSYRFRRTVIAGADRWRAWKRRLTSGASAWAGRRPVAMKSAPSAHDLLPVRPVCRMSSRAACENDSRFDGYRRLSGLMSWADRGARRAMAVDGPYLTSTLPATARSASLVSTCDARMPSHNSPPKAERYERVMPVDACRDYSGPLSSPQCCQHLNRVYRDARRAPTRWLVHGHCGSQGSSPLRSNRSDGT